MNHAIAYELVESTTWQVSKKPPCPIHIELRCGHLVRTDSTAISSVLHHSRARPVVRERQLRIEMRCAECESGKASS